MMQGFVLVWPNGKPRSMGGPFDILYAPRSKLASTTAPAKRGPKPKPKMTNAQKAIKTMQDNSASPFCTSIASKQDSDRTSKIHGKSL
jgi:hypothetical protein